MKTAVSIPDDIFKEIEKFAKEHRYSRSEVFAVAAREFLEKFKSKQILDTLNELYPDIETREDTALRKRAAAHYARKVLKEPY